MMIRNLDLAALRALAAVADAGGVTRAAGFLHLTQSAVSMQVKRLEEAVGQPLLRREGRGVRLTAQGEQMLGYARRMMALNDEALRVMTGPEHEGRITLGAPHDIVLPAMPGVLRRFTAAFPRVELELLTANTSRLKEMHGRGEVDAILTTEDGVGPGGAELARLPLLWVGADGGCAHADRPLPIAFESDCIFRPSATAALDAAGIGWRLATRTDSLRTVEAVVSADLAVHAALRGMPSEGMVQLPPGTLPALGSWSVGLYLPPSPGAPVAALAEMLGAAYSAFEQSITTLPVERLSRSIA
ncbi:MAG: LysR family transcriptional regulator [Hasllibacter sp.]